MCDKYVNFPTFPCFTNPYALQLTQKLHQLERDISRITLDEEGCVQLNQIMDKHKLDEINQRVELASDPSRADPRQPGKNDLNLNSKPFATLTLINTIVMSRHLIVFP